MKWLLTCFFILFALTAHAELPNAEDRPFWTEKTCYRLNDLVFAVGVSMNKNALETARKESFKAALWEISNYAQLSDTTLLLVETQMTYEEKTPQGTYSVWRLVKIPFPMIEKAKNLLSGNKASTRKTMDRIQKLEDENREDLADELRRALLGGDTAESASSPHPPLDKKLPVGTVVLEKTIYSSDEIIGMTLRATDETRLKTARFSIEKSKIGKIWALDTKRVTQKFSFPASILSPGKHVYSFEVTDSSGNISLNRGIFRIENLHDQLYDILSKDPP
jgi:hypothetical protein